MGAVGGTRRIVFVDGIDVVPAPDSDTTVVVLDTSWTPTADDRTDLLAARPLLQTDSARVHFQFRALRKHAQLEVRSQHGRPGIWSQQLQAASETLRTDGGITCALLKLNELYAVRPIQAHHCLLAQLQARSFPGIFDDSLAGSFRSHHISRIQ